jgi:hypothetical protein
VYEVLKVEERHQLEQLGTKEKFWFYDEHGKEKRLCKIGRPGTGENWAEKVAFELAKLLGVPCAEYHLAIWQDRQSVVSLPFLCENERLIHGNEILGGIDNSYHTKDAFKLRQYRLKTVIALFQKHLGEVSLPKGYKDADIHEPVELFILYLMFDCWIGNQDRHDQNWGLVLGKPQDGIFMAPSFDHASSLACRMFDKERDARLNTTDSGYSIENYLGRAKTPFFSNDGSRQLKTLECFQLSVELAKKQKVINKWVDKLESIERSQVEQVLAKVPEEFGMSEIAVEFTANYLDANKRRLLGVRS